MGAVARGDNSGGDYTRPDTGSYPARCIQVVELGHQDSKNFDGEMVTKKELMIVWELSELMQDGRPFVVNWRGTNSLNEKANLRKMLSSWRGKPFTEAELANFELKNILDKCCLLSVEKRQTKTGKDYSKVNGVVPLPKGLGCAERVNELVDFGIDDRSTELFEQLYPWVQDIVKKSHEASAVKADFNENDEEAF